MKSIAMFLCAGALALSALTAQAQGQGNTFSIQPATVHGFPTGEITLTGGGLVEVSSGFSHAGGGFSCTQDVNQGPLAGLKAGEGVRWDVDSILPSTTFKCTGAATEALKTATTGGTTVVLHADFYRAGDGINESFKANMIVSTDDLDPLLPGIQNVWVQGVGCGETQVVFH
jgi:hypothetical protein